MTMPSTLENIASGTDLTVSVEVDYRDVSWLPLGYLGENSTLSAAAEAETRIISFQDNTSACKIQDTSNQAVEDSPGSSRP